MGGEPYHRALYPAGQRYEAVYGEKVEAIADTTKVTNKEFTVHDGPFVKGLDDPLQSFGVHRQQYFGAVFVGNHSHKALHV
ncbi:hypothetical protein EMCRGX_G024928 [Ephydatia muelleri]